MDKGTNIKLYVSFVWTSSGGNIYTGPKHVTDGSNKIVKSYWNSAALDGNPWTWSNTRNRMQTTKFEINTNKFVYIHMKLMHCILNSYLETACANLNDSILKVFDSSSLHAKTTD
jgi:hypothetical protein